MSETDTRPDQVASHILLIEDDPVTAKILAGWLQAAGWTEVSCSHDGLEGTHMAQLGHWDLILIDIGLPSMSGMDVLRYVKSVVPWIPAVIVTATTSMTAVIEALENKADDFLAKPIVPQKLLEKVSRLIDRDIATIRPAA